MRKAIAYGFSLFAALAVALLVSLNGEQAPASIKITIIVGALVLVFVFLFIIPAMLTMMVRASL